MSERKNPMITIQKWCLFWWWFWFGCWGFFGCFRLVFFFPEGWGVLGYFFVDLFFVCLSFCGFGIFFLFFHLFFVGGFFFIFGIFYFSFFPSHIAAVLKGRSIISDCQPDLIVRGCWFSYTQTRGSGINLNLFS